ncbi:MAG: acyl-CoA dehydrogenase [Candidatus Freyarchaeota archaeon]|nr:acyl-CoA dehydrogenase [Candidatus Jordarchaeia archaeon]MBS7280313.1 acyl-CoA dehydrogenase [Candidatus Jordarchaeia archaeon]
MNFDLTEEQEMIRQTVQEFAQKELIPIADEAEEKGEFPKEVIKKAADLGFLGATIPPEYGGSGVDSISAAILIEELSRAWASIGTIIHVHNSVCCWPINHFGTEEQKKKYLPKLAKGEIIGAFTLTEPEAGSDASNVKTTAVLDGDEWVINGSKQWITNGIVAGVFLVFAVTDGATSDAKRKPISVLIVDRNTPGLKIGKPERKMGIHCSETAKSLTFEDCRIPKENVLGKVGEGYKVGMITLDQARIGIAAQGVGVAQAAFDEALKYSQQRVQFGQPIARFQAIQWMLAEMATEIEAARLLTYKAAYLKDKGERISMEAAMAKLAGGEIAMKAANMALQIHGGFGYVKDYPIERIFRDAKIVGIYEGTNEIQKLRIAGELLKGK